MAYEFLVLLDLVINLFNLSMQIALILDLVMSFLGLDVIMMATPEPLFEPEVS
ncbi:hypothetical protein RhiirC2_800316 [Rhizophagus irregularis]|uniref:Uncharacterized protein n=1 Tax=Rhizophagus irregularis TaxID=588596 RepID=A0A2N1M3U7_9GLOM|nr:hypothetical protein RhiirC2_800316 [Rhizophagus irregularis]